MPNQIPHTDQTPSFSKLTAFAEPLVRRIGERLSRAIVAQDFVVREKAKDDVVTEMDLWSESEIKQAVAECYPSHVVAGEESVSQGLTSVRKSVEENEYCWVVDPLDGTANFASGIPHFAISLALMKRAEPLYGCVYDPSRDELFTAYKSEGAFLNGAAILPRKRKDIGDAVILSGLTSASYQKWDDYRPVLNELGNRSHKLRIQGAGVLDQCWVAMGRVDAFFQYGLFPWDKAAAGLIVIEAGAEVGCPGTSRGYDLYAPSTLVASGNLYQKLSDLVESLQ